MDADIRARWGRAAMASYFVVAATLDIAARQSAWDAAIAGLATPLQWLQVLVAVALLVSATLFAWGRGVGVIARGWIAYVAVHAATAHAFWAGGPEAVVAHSGPFLADMAVAASLLMFLSWRERTDPHAA